MTLREKALLAEKAARTAGEMLLNHPHTPARHKAENDFVTEMDVKSEELIRSILLDACPDDGFFGEEEGGNEIADGRWIVDPIDGTQSFMRGHHGYTVSIAYEQNGELAIGCVYAPDTDEMFLAVRGQGATLNGAPIHVSDIADPKHALAHLGYGHRVPKNFERTVKLLPDILARVSDIRRYGSAAYALCCLACGRSEIFFELGLKYYDVAAGAVILQEAGGRVGGWREGEDCLRGGSMLATNGLLHSFMQDMLRGE